MAVGDLRDGGGSRVGSGHDEQPGLNRSIAAVVLAGWCAGRDGAQAMTLLKRPNRCPRWRGGCLAICR